MCVWYIWNGSGSMRCSRHVCDCSSGEHLSIYYFNKATCIKPIDVTDNMYKVKGTNAYVDEASCRYALGM